jgi:cellulose synthase/poly-beta-1,6-N-acetylglucosamine synthase-like glycosyltransferase
MFALGLVAAAAGLILYTVAGYPALLALTRRRAPAIAKDLAFRTSVSVLIPAHNGAAFMRRKLTSVLGLQYPRELLEVIVISDGSTDETDAIVQEFAPQGVHLLRVETRSGKTNALNVGLSRASGEILFFTDVRQHFKPDALAHLVANFADPTVGAVSGELHLLPGESGEQADMNAYWRYELWARNRHSQIDSVFNTTGSIYAMRRALAAPLPPDTIADDAFQPFRAFFAGYRVVLDSQAIAYDYPAVAGTEFRRRLRTLAGLWQVYRRTPELFSARNRMRFHFLSHKFTRLLLPWAVLLLFAATPALPSGFLRAILLAGEGGVLLLAALDWLTPRSSPFKRLSSPARTFLTMNAAAAMAVLVFFVPAQQLWRPTRVRAVAASPEAR